MSALNDLRSRYPGRWPTLDAAITRTNVERSRIRSEIARRALLPADCEVIVFGSLARHEFTQQSDVDWTLLVDGMANPRHRRITQEIGALLVEMGMGEPGRTGTFGTLCFSHNLLHEIGGQSDTNLNTTRRVLLLLESCAVGGGAGQVRPRFIRHLLGRYLNEDLGYHELHSYKRKVPRFLLNDIVRYWRTMAVDYAAKRSERGAKGWATRNLKLRVSRKLTYGAGLAMCLSCQLFPSEGLNEQTRNRDQGAFYDELKEFLLDFIDCSPLDNLVRFARDMKSDGASVAVELVDTYEAFLSILDNKEKRNTLDALDVDGAASCTVFQEAREVGADFQKGLTKLFFETDDEVTRITQRYGVF